MSDISITVMWARPALEWLAKQSKRANVLPSSSVAGLMNAASPPPSSASAILTQRMQTISASPAELHTTSVVQFVLRCADTPAGNIYAALLRALSQSSMAASASGSAVSRDATGDANKSKSAKTKSAKDASKPSKKTSVSSSKKHEKKERSGGSTVRRHVVSTFVSRLMQHLCVRLLGQCVSWTSAVGAAHHAGACLTIEINEEDEDSDGDDGETNESGEEDDDDATTSASASGSSENDSSRDSSSSSSGSSSSSSSSDDEDDEDAPLNKKGKASKSSGQKKRQHQQKNSKKATTNPKKSGGTRRARDSEVFSLISEEDDDDDDDENVAQLSSSRQRNLLLALPGVDETPQWSMSGFIREQKQRQEQRLLQEHQGQHHPSSSSATAAATAASPYLPSRPWSFVDEMLLRKHQHQEKVMATTTTTSTATGASSPLVAAATASTNVSVLPIVVGSVGRWLGPDAERTQSREWHIYVRGHLFQDLSTVIDKVVFHLHETFRPPVRTVTSPPFELRERGWGQFAAAIEIHFKTSDNISIGNSGGGVGQQHALSSKHSINQQSQHPPLAVRLTHLIRFDTSPPKPFPSLIADPSNHYVPPLGREYLPDVEKMLPTFSDGSDTPAVWEEYDELVIVRPPPFLRAAIERYNAASAALIHTAHQASGVTAATSGAGGTTNAAAAAASTLSSTSSPSAAAAIISALAAATSKKAAAAVNSALGFGVPDAIQVSVKKMVVEHGVPSLKLCDDTGDFKALSDVRDAIAEIVERRLQSKMAQQGGGGSGGGGGGGGTLVATSAAVARLTDARAWNHYRRLADTLNDTQNDAYAPF